MALGMMNRSSEEAIGDEIGETVKVGVGQD